MTLVSSAISAVRNWWWFAIKGLLLLAAGVAILIRPAEGYVGLSVLFSVVIFCVGLVQIAFAAGNRAWLSGWGWTLASGIIDLTVGIFLMAFPGVTLATLPFFLGFWLMFRAFYLMGIAFDLNHSGVLFGVGIYRRRTGRNGPGLQTAGRREECRTPKERPEGRIGLATLNN